MLDKITLDQIKKLIKEINKEKNIDQRLEYMINHKDSIRNAFNEVLDDLFSEIDLTVKRYQIEDDL